MTGPELERETFRDRDGREIAWPRVEPRTPPELEAMDEHEPPLDDPDDARWLAPYDPRRPELEPRPYDQDAELEGDR